MARHDASGTHQVRSGAARLVRLAAVACLALAVAGSAAVWAHGTGETAAGHRCIHDEVQQRVLQSVAQEHNGGRGTLSAVGLPVVAAESLHTAGHGGVDFALPDGGTPRKLARSAKWGELRITVSIEVLTDPDRHCTQDGQEISNHNSLILPYTAGDILTDEKGEILLESILPGGGAVAHRAPEAEACAGQLEGD